MLEILTPLQKLERVSRKIDAANFIAAPGVWAQVTADGSLLNVVTATPGLVNKLVIGNASNNMYESHDVEVGRITTLESIGARCKVDSDGVHGTISAIQLGDLLYVSAGSGHEGKLASVRVNPDTLHAGVYEVVGRVEQIDATAGWVLYRTISPSTHTFT
jgi:hypothetical protein